MVNISTFPMSSARNAYASGVVVNHETPFEQRWGEWYVTGDAVPDRHLGNVPVVQSDAQLARPPGPPPRLRSIETQFDTAGYFSTFSDVVALTVLGHQAHMTNLPTRVGWEARLAAAPASGAIAPRRGEAAARPPLDDAVNRLVDYMLFVDEAVLPQPIRGTSGFAETFSSSGPRDTRGRSLRDLDLQRRLLRHRCSYMCTRRRSTRCRPPRRGSSTSGCGRCYPGATAARGTATLRCPTGAPSSRFSRGDESEPALVLSLGQPQLKLVTGQLS